VPGAQAGREQDLTGLESALRASSKEETMRTTPKKRRKSLILPAGCAFALLAASQAALAQQVRPIQPMPHVMPSVPSAPGMSPQAVPAAPDVVMSRPGGCPEGIGKCPPQPLPIPPRPDAGANQGCEDGSPTCRRQGQ
jgi:hypothetical protein